MPCPLPPCGVGPVVVLVGPAPPVWGSVFYRDMVWLLPLVNSSVIAMCSLPYKNMMLLFSPCKRCPCPCSDAVLRSCEEALAGIILHRPPSLRFAWVRSGCAGQLGAGADVYNLHPPPRTARSVVNFDAWARRCTSSARPGDLGTRVHRNTLPPSSLHWDRLLQLPVQSQ